jgi:hypothetical protein
MQLRRESRGRAASVGEARLARSLPPREIALRAYRLYEVFRPEVPAGVRGWGAAGELDLDRIEALAEQ